jgi:hypothetical protein
MFMFELMGDVCGCGGGCSRYWHAEGKMWGPLLTDDDWVCELPDGIFLGSWGESGCTWGLSLEVEVADWFLVLGTSLSDGAVREIIRTLRETGREEIMQWTVDFNSGCAMGPFGLDC